MSALAEIHSHLRRYSRSACCRFGHQRGADSCFGHAAFKRFGLRGSVRSAQYCALRRRDERLGRVDGSRACVRHTRRRFVSISRIAPLRAAISCDLASLPFFSTTVTGLLSARCSTASHFRRSRAGTIHCLHLLGAVVFAALVSPRSTAGSQRASHPRAVAPARTLPNRMPSHRKMHRRQSRQ